MTKNVKLIYDLIQKDLKARGWDELAITEAIAECERERQKIGADDNTLCVKEMSYLSQESLQKVAQQMDNKKHKTNILIRLKNWVVNLAKGYWRLNWEAKIGILFLIPSIIVAIIVIVYLLFISFGSNDFYFDYFPDICIGVMNFVFYDNNSNMYLGMMAIAGAYLIKGNLKK